MVFVFFERTAHTDEIPHGENPKSQFLGRDATAKNGNRNDYGARNINFVERFPGSPPGLLIFVAQGFIGFAVSIFLSRIFLSALLNSLRN